MRSTLWLMVAVISFSACTRTPDARIQVAIESYPKSADPRIASDAFSVRLSRLLCPGVMTLDASLNPVPALAESVTFQSPTSVAITLNPKARFSTGASVTAGDVIETYRSIQRLARSPFHKDFQVISEMSSVSDRDVHLKLERPFAPLPTLLTVGVLPSALAAKESVEFENLTCAGPYRAHFSRRNQELVLEPNLTYALPSPPTTGIRFRIVPDGSVRALELQKQSIDLVQNALNFRLLTALEAKPFLAIEAAAGVSLTYLGFNFRDPILRNPLVRRAIAHLIDRESLIRSQFAGRARLATGLLPETNWAYEADVATYPFDRERAEALLDQAGLRRDPKTKTRFRLKYKTSTDQQRIEIAGILANQLGQAGIDVEVQPLEFGTFMSDIQAGNFQLYSLKWTDISEPDLFYWVFHSENFSPNGGNRNHYKNPEMDRWIEVGRKNVDLKARKKAYSEIQKLAARELPYVFLWFEDHVAVVNRRVSGYTLSASGDFAGLVRATLVRP